MAIEVKTLEKLVSDMYSSFAAELNIEPVSRDGDPVRALYQAIALALLFILTQIQRLETFSRASTAVGADLDSFIEGDYGLARLPAVQATGIVTFSIRATRGTATLISLGSLVQNADGSQIYQVVADTSLGGYSTEQSAYIIAAGQLTVNARIKALVAGSGGNLQPGKIVKVLTGGADDVTNEFTISGGSDEEADADYRKRFVLWINSRPGGIEASIYEAALGVQSGLNVKLLENITPAGDEQGGFFTVIVDDGTGEPSEELIQQEIDAIRPRRGFTIQYDVVGPTAEDVEVAMVIVLDEDFESAGILSIVKDALFEYINGLEIGESLYLSKLIAVAVGISGVISVQPHSTLINGEEEDLIADGRTVVRIALEDLAVTAED